MPTPIELTYYQVVFSSRPDVDEADMAYFEADPLSLYRGALEGVPVTLWMPSLDSGGRRLIKVPVRASFPPGWNPDEADGRSKAFAAQGRH